MAKKKPTNMQEDLVLKTNEDEQRKAEILAQQREKLQEFEDSKISWRNSIGLYVDEQRNGIELEDDDESNNVDEFDNVDEENIDQEVITEKNIDQEDDEYDDSTPITKVINGKKITRTLGEWIQIANKVEDADQYYTQAVNKYHESRKQPEEQVDVSELAKQIQLGSEDEAAKALEKVINVAANNAKKEKQQVDIQEAGKAIYVAFSNEYKDIVSDPILNAALNQLDAQMMNKVYDADPIRNFDKRLRECGNTIRQWRNKNDSSAVKTEQRKELVQKKQKITNLNTASQKQSSNQQKPLNEKQARELAIQDMFKSRKRNIY